MSTSPDSTSGVPLPANAGTSLATLFQRLAVESNWEENAAEHRSQRADFVRGHFEAIFGNGSNLAGWQALCRVVGIKEIPSSMKECKKVSSVNVILFLSLKMAGFERERERESSNSNFAAVAAE